MDSTNEIENAECGMDLRTQAQIICSMLPEADVRTDQCEILRVYLHSAMLMGSIQKMKDDVIQWSITDLALEEPIPCVTGPPQLQGEVQDDEIEAARCLAFALKRAVEGKE